MAGEGAVTGQATGLTRTVARLLLAPAVMVALAMLVKGYADTGDGFSAGVILGAAIGLQYLAGGIEQVRGLRIDALAPWFVSAGLLLALTVAFAPVLRGDPVMTHYPRAGKPVIHLGSLELLTALAFDVGVFLLVSGFVAGTIDLLDRRGAGETGE